MTTVAIVGSQLYPRPDLVREIVEKLPRENVVISGGAKGPDTWAIDHAKDLGMQTIVYHADWEAFGKPAGMIRNATIVKQCDFLIAFFDGKSPGTLDVARKAYRAAKLAFLYDVDGDIVDPRHLFGYEKPEKEPSLFGEEEA